MIKNIRITNFKSLRDVEVTFSPVTVLVGLSGTGKTNLVNAFRFLRDYLLKSDQEALRDHGGWHFILPANRGDAFDLSFRVVFDLPEIEGNITYKLAFAREHPSREPKLWEEELSVGGHSVFHQHEGRWVTKPRVANHPNPGQLMIRQIQGIHEVSIAYLVLTKGIGCYDFRGDVLLNPASWPHISGLSDHGENFIEILDGILSNLSLLKNWKQLNRTFQALNPSVKGIDVNRPKPSYVIVSHEMGGKAVSMALRQESEGLRRFLVYLIAMYQSPSKHLLIFEEPEKGIYPGALSVLADQFKACADNGRGQVLLTTHSPQLLDEFSPETIRVVELDNYETKIGPMARDQLESIKERLMSPGELLTVQQPRLTEAPVVGQDAVQ